MDTAVCTLESLSSRGRQLFTLPTVAMDVLDLTANREVDVEQIRVCIERDPALVAKLLRVVNSSLYGSHGTVRDLRQALTLIGLNPLRLLVLGFCLPERLLKGVAQNVLSWYWRQTLTKAVAAREFAVIACPVLADEVFVTGLLRDIGILLLIQELDQPYLKLVDQAIRSGIDLREIEQMAMGFDHVQLSSRMMEGWGFPPSLRARDESMDGVSFDSPETTMAPRVLYLAEIATQLLAGGKTSLFPDLLESAQRLLRISEPQTEAILDTIEEKVRQLAGVLSLKLPENLDYQSLLAAARDRLIQAADEAAGDLVHESNVEAVEPEAAPELRKTVEEEILLASGQAAATRVPRDGEAQAELETTRAVSVSSRSNRQGPVVSAGGRESAGNETAAEESSGLAEEILAACGPFAGPEEVGGHGPAQEGTAGKSSGLGTSGRGSSVAASPVMKPRSEVPEEPQLLRQLRTATAACHRLRCPASLLAVDFSEDPETFGSDNATILKELLRLACQTSCGEQKILLEFEKNGRAVILLNTDRDLAVSTAHEVVDSFRHAIPFCFGHNAPDATIDVGVVTLAMPPSDYDPNRFVDAVKRCLYASHASGGNRVKSVDIG